MSTPARRRIILALTGASGAIYGRRLLHALLDDKAIEVHLTISPPAQRILKLEEGIEVDLANFSPAALLPSPRSGRGGGRGSRLVYHRNDNVGAAIASGSFRAEAMAIVPCSMGCAGAIAHGISADLIQRTADVMLKERRKLILVPRETPLSAIHLENLLTLAKLGALILPASPGFYSRPQTVAELVDFVVARILDHLDVEHKIGKRWGG